MGEIANPQSADIQRIFDLQKQHQWAVARTDHRQRKAKLMHLHDTVLRYENEIRAALWQDLRKGETETSISEIGAVCGEIRHTCRHLQSWMTPKRVITPIVAFGANSEIRYEPRGVCLVLSPWNFPFNLTLIPIVSAVAAGNTVIAKASEHAPASAALMKKIVEECFPPEEVAMVEGDANVARTLTSMPFDHIFFTGGPEIGKHVMAAAALNLTSVTLELGGKNPTFVHDSADLDNAAAKIAWVKAFNAGQMCTAPDYVLVDEKLRDKLVARIGDKFSQFYGHTPEARRQSPDYCRLIHPQHYQRVKALLDDAVSLGAKIAWGGACIAEEKFIEPTILIDIPENAKIWQEEIFGPLLPVRTYQTIEQALTYVNARPKPLAAYIFSTNRRVTDQILAETRSGGVTVNDCSTHFYNFELPFGGVNYSGMGSCHGEFGFKQFSHERGVLRQFRLFPTTNLLLPPYGGKIASTILYGLKRLF
ncbi:MAG: aldehyde dehydrogenase family protein [Saprospiraceae bacterium]|nr:aldehyde dehydrogenase family protein [Saprospiraceae bacterium]